MDNVTPGRNAPQSDEPKKEISHKGKPTRKKVGRMSTWSRWVFQVVLFTAAVAEIVTAVWTIFHPV